MDSTADSRNETANESRIFGSENIGNFAPAGRFTHAFQGGNNFQQKDL